MHVVKITEFLKNYFKYNEMPFLYIKILSLCNFYNIIYYNKNF